MTTSIIAWIIFAISCIASAILYRLGGIGNPFSGKLRDVGVAIITSLALYILLVIR